MLWSVNKVLFSVVSFNFFKYQQAIRRKKIIWALELIFFKVKVCENKFKHINSSFQLFFGQLAACEPEYEK